MQEVTDLPFKSIVNKISEELFIYDSESDHFVYSNKALLTDLNYTESEFLELQWNEIFIDDQRELFKERLNKVLFNETDTVTLQIDLQRKDGSYYPAKVELSSFYTDDNDSLILGICRNISDEKRNHSLLEKEKKKTRDLQLSTKYKSEFFANLSHEMRTTLNSVLLLSEILTENRGKNLTQEELKYSKTIHHSTNSLLFLINEFLDMAKIESGKISLRPELVEIYDFCKQLERLFQPVASEKGVQFSFHYEIQSDLPFKTDHMRLEQVLKNLISNALKFTPEGSVQLKVFTNLDNRQINGLPEHVYFQIKDTGIGISEDQQEHIFDSYVQAEGAETAAKFGGTGLGLSISNEIVSLLGGNISIDSKLGKGSIFTVKLPLDSSEAIVKNATEGKVKLSTAPAKGDRFPQAKNTAPEKINGTVLLIDDSETHNMALSEFLSFKVNRCITAESAKQAFEILRSQPVHCIILDMFLPDASGKEVLKSLKSDNQLANIPVIIYSGKNISQEEEQDLEKQADAIIQKNVMSYKVLLSKITGVLRKASEPMG